MTATPDTPDVLSAGSPTAPPGPSPGASAAIRERSIQELRDEALTTTSRRPRRRRTPSAGLMKRSAAFRAHNLSESHIAMLRENSRKWREANGGKVPTRKGVPDGWASKSRKKLCRETIAAAEAKAEVAVDRLVRASILQDPGLGGLLDPSGNLDKAAAGIAVLKHAIAIALAKTPAGENVYPSRERLQAARLVLTYTTSKPVPLSHVRVSAEAFLEGLLLAPAGPHPQTSEGTA